MFAISNNTKNKEDGWMQNLKNISIIYNLQQQQKQNDYNIIIGISKHFNIICNLSKTVIYWCCCVRNDETKEKSEKRGDSNTIGKHRAKLGWIEQRMKWEERG